MSPEISLRKPTLENLKFIQWLWSDPETMAPVGGPIVLDDDGARDWFENVISPGSPEDDYRLIVHQGDTPVGEISYHRLDPGTMTADLNIKIASPHRGKGYGKKALLLFLDTFFNKTGGQVMQDKVGIRNIHGRNFLMDCGFEQDPSYDDVHFLKLTRARFNTLHNTS